MAQKNSNLHTAKAVKNDEFYTRISDIENEMRHYKKHFQDKVVFCNCDDPTWSEFWRYFHLNFTELGLKKLISTHYDAKEVTYKLEYFGGEDDNIEAGVKTRLMQNGDFRSDESIALLKESDIVVTNPPFSLFREYIAQLMEYDKKFIIIGNKNAITYKEFFPLLKDNKVWIGYNAVKEFLQPDGSIKKFGNIGWYTNLDIKKRHEELILWKNYNSDEYPHYDNYNAINCDKVSEIPVDYCESWGVTNDVFDKLNPNEWEVVRMQKIDENVVLNFVVPAKNTELREILSKHEPGYKEQIESALTNTIYCSGYMGVPITFLDNYDPEQFNIVNANDIRQNDDVSVKPHGLIKDKEATITNAETSMVEADRQTDRQTDKNNLCSNRYSSSDVMESSEYQLHSSTGTIRNNSQFSDLTDTCSTTHDMDIDSTLMEKKPTHEYLSIIRCNGNIGVPITILDKFNPDQFEVMGITCRGYSPELRTKTYEKEQYKNANDLNGSGVILKNGILIMTYGRVIIRNKYYGGK